MRARSFRQATSRPPAPSSTPDEEAWQRPEVIALNGILLIEAGKANDAVNALELAVKDSPKDPFLQYWLGRAALANGDPDLAERSFLEVAKTQSLHARRRGTAGGNCLAARR